MSKQQKNFRIELLEEFVEADSIEEALQELEDNLGEYIYLIEEDDKEYN